LNQIQAIGPSLAAKGRPAKLYTPLYMAGSTRTQIYLTAQQRARLDALGRREDKALAELVREAVDLYLARSAPDAAEALAATFGALPKIEAPSRDAWS
jgi:hypothetical protein